jgi:uncharacterized protein YkwD
VKRSASLRRAAALLAVAGTTIGGFAAGGVHASAAVGTCTPGSDWPAARPDLAAGILSLVNAHRTAMGLSALKTSATLTASATWKARHMARYLYMGHDDPAPPVARSWADRIAACGYPGAAGENLAAGYRTPAAAVQAWLADPPHRANMERPWTTTGIGVAVSSSGIVFWAQDFGYGSGSSPSPPGQTAGRHCVVPGVFHLPAAQAVKRVRQAGCAARKVHVHVAAVRAGLVAWQSPRRHVTMPRGAVVTLAVSAKS